MFPSWPETYATKKASDATMTWAAFQTIVATAVNRRKRTTTLEDLSAIIHSNHLRMRYAEDIADYHVRFKTYVKEYNEELAG